jgi:hypothetical protein
MSCADCGGVSHPAHCSAVGALDIGALVSICETGPSRGALSGVDEADMSSQETGRTSVWIQCIMSTPSNINAQDKLPPVKRCVRSCVWLKEEVTF